MSILAQKLRFLRTGYILTAKVKVFLDQIST
jgi:hypothetical protein